ncbi:hypothetical protein [Sulfitobacter sp. HI0021]|uniref:hypothetical protein n=2 Tax=Sulfitobacter TaxID=60136 RepID=UPI00123716C0|nr:hypothetical protein [Sulfitobacter sp. HI0021]
MFLPTFLNQNNNLYLEGTNRTMTVVKREISLIEALGAYLCYTPKYTETDEFHADLRTLNHTLFRDAIRECHNGKKEEHVEGAPSKRQLIHMVYTRKVKELASLYPFLFATENALRAIAHESYHRAFKDPYWWRDIIRAHTHEKTENDFPLKGDGKKRVRKHPVNPSFLAECFFAATQLGPRQIKALDAPACSSIRFYEELSIRHLFKIMHSDYVLCTVGTLKRQQFKEHMITICDARNEVFHGRPIKNRSTLFSACEAILDAAGLHMGDFDKALQVTTYTRQTPSMKRSKRHLLPPPPFVLP